SRGEQAEVRHLDHVRVAEPRGGARLGEESTRVEVAVRSTQQLDGHGLADDGVPSAEDEAVAALADARADEGLTDRAAGLGAILDVGQRRAVVLADRGVRGLIRCALATSLERDRTRGDGRPAVDGERAHLDLDARAARDERDEDLADVVSRPRLD